MRRRAPAGVPGRCEDALSPAGYCMRQKSGQSAGLVCRTSVAPGGCPCDACPFPGVSIQSVIRCCEAAEESATGALRSCRSTSCDVMRGAQTPVLVLPGILRTDAATNDGPPWWL